MNNKKYPCPCCGYLVFNEAPGSFDICPICYWEDEALQLRYPNEIGANRLTLIESQINFEALGYGDLQNKKLVRKINKHDEKDKKWRKIDLKLDVIEEKVLDEKRAVIYPIDSTELYYWSENFWLKKKA